MLQWNLIDETNSDASVATVGAAHALASPASLLPASSLPTRSDVSNGSFQLDWSARWTGKALGMPCLTIDTGAIATTILPYRGMGLWKCWASGNALGWQSPVTGPVHPSLVPVGDPTGIGWLEGFDELLVRCGLLSNGAPEFDAHGVVRYPVHGRIANLPAHALRIELDPDAGTLDVIGRVRESRFLVYALELESRIRFHAGRALIEITDTVTNVTSTPGSMQLLYHINLGQPILQSGSRIEAPLEIVAPRDARAAEGIDDWDRCRGPESGYREQVYFGKPLADDKHWSMAMLANADSSLGVSVHFDTRTLPAVTFWKNTAAVEDGYVVGLEPATGFPNARSFEEKQNRVVRLHGGESRCLRLKLEPHLDRESVDAARSRIRALQTQAVHVERTPKAGWSASASGS